MSGLMRTALTEISMPGMDLVCNKKISLSSFCRRRAILFCLVVSYCSFFYAGVQPVFTLAKLLKYIVLPTVYSFFFILFPIVGFILFRSVDEICLFVDSICCSCYASLTLMSVRRTADDE